MTIIRLSVMEEVKFLYKSVSNSTMLKEYKNDPLLRKLVDMSWFKEAELDSLLCYKFASNQSKGLKEAILLRDKKVAIGSFFRSYRQGRRVISRSLATLLLSSLLGLVGSDIMNSIPNLDKVLHELTNNQESYHKVIVLLEEFLNGMV